MTEDSGLCEFCESPNDFAAVRCVFCGNRLPWAAVDDGLAAQWRLMADLENASGPSAGSGNGTAPAASRAPSQNKWSRNVWAGIAPTVCVLGLLWIAYMLLVWHNKADAARDPGEFLRQDAIST
jgi:hypothetical protein